MSFYLKWALAIGLLWALAALAVVAFVAINRPPREHERMRAQIRDGSDPELLGTTADASAVTQRHHRH